MSHPRSVRQLRRELTRSLEQSGILHPGSEVLQMMTHLLNLDVTQMYAEPDRPVDELAADRLYALVERRKKHEPLAYLLGHVWFSGLRFVIGPGVLVPRPDSEVLVETARLIALEQLWPGLRDQAAPLRMLDTCTGTGCIGISLAHQLEQAGCAVLLTLVDMDDAALCWAGRNARLHLPQKPVTICSGDLFPADVTEAFDLITANPPYIESDIIAGLMPEISHYEPLLALDGGQDGLTLYRRLAAEAPACLKPGGWLILEHGFSQATAVSGILKQENYNTLPIQYDFGANPRVCAGQLPV